MGMPCRLSVRPPWGLPDARIAQSCFAPLVWPSFKGIENNRKERGLTLSHTVGYVTT